MVPTLLKDCMMTVSTLQGLPLFILQCCIALLALYEVSHEGEVVPKDDSTMARNLHTMLDAGDRALKCMEPEAGDRTCSIYAVVGVLRDWVLRWQEHKVDFSANFVAELEKVTVFVTHFE